MVHKDLDKQIVIICIKPHRTDHDDFAVLVPIVSLCIPQRMFIRTGNSWTWCLRWNHKLWVDWWIIFQHKVSGSTDALFMKGRYRRSFLMIELIPCHVDWKKWDVVVSFSSLQFGCSSNRMDTVCVPYLRGGRDAIAPLDVLCESYQATACLSMGHHLSVSEGSSYPTLPSWAWLTKTLKR